ncbi:hypothetical protein [Streptococcus marmotae]|uniref:hypothetical protein n=1 Tax=Streptococcus marmotae TaxID=1825069 RepID=UPI00082E1882|nr:hypothetical protein [Streptococcus marmotae]QBX16936.1 hypothetical protein Javan291_0060 [Streptococcus phage Javan291]
MALRLYSSASYNAALGKTLVGIKESDERETVLFNATLDGDHSQDSDADLIRLALDWFTVRYVKNFSDQLLNDKVNEATKVISEVQSKYAELEDRLTKAEEERAEQFKQAESERNERFENLENAMNQAVVELTTMFAGRLEEEEQTDDEATEKEVAEEVEIGDEEKEAVDHEAIIG